MDDSLFMEKVREIVFYKEYFQIFFEKLNEKTKNKIDEVLFMSQVLFFCVKYFFSYTIFLPLIFLFMTAILFYQNLYILFFPTSTFRFFL